VGNRRTDAYGGDLQGRMRFALELVEAVRAAWPDDKPLFVRVSVVDGKGGHWDMDDTVVFAKELKARGVDFIDCSCGGLGARRACRRCRVISRLQCRLFRSRPPGGRYAHHRRRMITEPEQAEAILREGKADIIASRARCCAIRTGRRTPPRRWAERLAGPCCRRTTLSACIRARRSDCGRRTSRPVKSHFDAKHDNART